MRSYITTSQIGSCENDYPTKDILLINETFAVNETAVFSVVEHTAFGKCLDDCLACVSFWREFIKLSICCS